MSAYLDPSNTGVEILDGTSTSGGINISHQPINDMPYSSDSISISANVVSNSGNLEAVELYYKLDDRFENEQMSSSFGDNYQVSIENLYGC